VQVFESALPSEVFKSVHHALGDDAFWDGHGYPTDGFFSYNIPLKAPMKGLIAQAIKAIKPRLEEATGEKFVAAEWWAHRRGGGADGGHQMHFDLDELRREQQQVLKHPTYSSVLYVECGEGTAPTVITDYMIEQGEDDAKAQCWRCHSAPNRLLVFKGCALHGVVPVLMPSGGTRITLMIGWWSEAPCTSPAPELKDQVRVGLGPNMKLPSGGKQPWQKLLLHSSSGVAVNKGQDCMELNRSCIESCGDLWCAVAPQPAGEKPKKPTAGAAGMFTGHFFVQDPSEIRLSSLPNAAGAGLAEGEFIDVEEMSLDDLKRLRGEI
jgi:hypothetical protein